MGARASVALTALVALMVLGGLTGCSTDGFRAPIENVPIENAEWDGTQFVVHNNVFAEGSMYWTSVDGLEWEGHEGFHMAGLPFPCHPDFPCDLEPTGEIAEIPYHYANTYSRAAAGRGDIVLTEVGINYRIYLEENSRSNEIHPQILEAAAKGSDCFKEAALAARNPVPPDGGPADLGRAYASGWGQDSNIVTVTCSNGDRFQLDLATVLTKSQLKDGILSPPPELMSVHIDGTVTPVPDPPRTTWVDDESTTRVSASPITASAELFWSVDRGTLVSSVNGVEWQPVDLPAALDVVAVKANHGGNVAVSGETGEVLVSHDDGKTWGPTFSIGPDPLHSGVTDIGPSAVAVIRDSDLLIFDTQTGEPLFKITDRMSGLLQDVGVGPDTVVVPQLSTRADGYDDALFEVYDLSGQLLGNNRDGLLAEAP